MGHGFIPLTEVDLFFSSYVSTSALGLNPPPHTWAGSFCHLVPRLANKVSTSVQYLSAEQNPDLPQWDNAPNPSSINVRLNTWFRFWDNTKWKLAIIDRIAFVKKGDNILGSVCPFVCLYALSCLHHLTLIFGRGSALPSVAKGNDHKYGAKKSH